ncbi:hypothetical protein PPYC1_22110 [Paenibacillus polymyxa]|uniref:Ig-like domain-containing protein n=1 Tax=Paenibacillus polymyxa TaxID=1406 RepID=A0ABX2ZF75_PAEPO|nr:hypothetical protein ABE82_02160 [Paenibacillus peoriae]APB72909.1 hypothetical protein PPYC1_22110 [Paenibacillus polymyxa]APQ57621.1 hypothetical protein VK72_02005 [Paenibacillus polymyxa]ODA07270.1 hypothetical protein A7312_09230 [Paenibacillus polymyxa]ODB58738.1 hypothetical protein A7309_22545 [Paenibacillus polymyxa]
MLAWHSYKYYGTFANDKQPDVMKVEWFKKTNATKSKHAENQLCVLALYSDNNFISQQMSDSTLSC